MTPTTPMVEKVARAIRKSRVKKHATFATIVVSDPPLSEQELSDARAAIEAIDGPKWEDISTAKRDGSEWLVASPNGDRNIARWERDVAAYGHPEGWIVKPNLVGIMCPAPVLCMPVPEVKKG